MDTDALPPYCTKRWAFVSPIKKDLEKHIDWYGNVRIKKRLDGSSPVEYRLGRAADSLLLMFRNWGPFVLGTQFNWRFSHLEDCLQARVKGSRPIIRDRTLLDLSGAGARFGSVSFAAS